MAAFSFTSIARTALRATAVLTIALGAAACGDDDDDGISPSAAAGTYSLVRVNNDATAPFVVFEGTQGGFTFRYEFTSATLTLRSDGTYTSTFSDRMQVTGEPDETSTETETGRFTVSGSTITFDPDASGETNFSGTLNNNEITMSDTDPTSGTTFTVVFRK